MLNASADERISTACTGLLEYIYLLLLREAAQQNFIIMQFRKLATIHPNISTIASRGCTPLANF